MKSNQMEVENGEKAYWVVVAETPGIGPKKFFELLKIFGSAEAIWTASTTDLRINKLSEKIVTLITRRRSIVDPVEHLQSLAKMGVTPTTYYEEGYPKLLKEIASAPPVIFVKGGLTTADRMALAVVGTRKPTSYGREVTEKLVMELVGYGFSIVSGLARGVDGIAHRAALEAGGRTIGWLGGGIDHIYPVEHAGLAVQIQKQGALVSEYQPGITPNRGSFPARNRLISGMSLGVLVIEGISLSGTKHTANHAKKQGRPVFAVPGQITSSMSDAPMDLLKEGAVMVRSGKDVVDYLIDNQMVDRQKITLLGDSRKSMSEKAVKFENELEELIYLILEVEPMESDEVIRKSTMPSEQVLMTLSIMELKGMVVKRGNEYRIAR